VTEVYYSGVHEIWSKSGFFVDHKSGPWHNDKSVSAGRGICALDPHLLKLTFLQVALSLAASLGPNELPRDVRCEVSPDLKLAQLPEQTAQNPVAMPDNLPFLVFIHSTCCPVCAKVRPIMKELEKSYNGKVQFIYLDVTDDRAKVSARKLAKSKGLGAFFALYEDTFPCVGVFNSKKKCVKELYGFQTKQKYASVIDKTIASN
jgi:thiol-disulfide isomerase/thioredoxin